MKIFKYKIEISHYQQLEVPQGAIFRDIQIQDGNLCAWFFVDPSIETTEFRQINMVGTGQEMLVSLSNFSLNHIKTVQQGCFVCHIFMEKTENDICMWSERLC